MVRIRSVGLPTPGGGQQADSPETAHHVGAQWAASDRHRRTGDTPVRTVVLTERVNMN